MPDHSPYLTTREEVYSLSGPAVLALLCAALEQNAPFRFRATGASMAPCIRDGDIITVVPLHNNGPRAGAVVAFRMDTDGPRLLVHRIVARRNARWLLRGDNALEPDGLIAPVDILGRVVRVERDGRPVRLGLGSEGRLIAWLSRRGWLPTVIRGCYACTRPFRRPT